MTGAALWRLDGPHQTFLFASIDNRIPECVYWGAPLPARQNEDALTAWALAGRRAPIGGMLSGSTGVALLPERSAAFLGAPGIEAMRPDGTAWATRFEVVDVEAIGQGLYFVCRDAAARLALSIGLGIEPRSGCLSGVTQIVNEGENDLHLPWLSAPVLPGPAHGAEIIDYTGRWCREFQPQRTPWRAGAHLREIRTGRTDHQHYPGLHLPAQGGDSERANPERGGCYALQMGWSGGARVLAEQTPDGLRQVQMGAATIPGERVLKPGEAHASPPIFATYRESLSETASSFHALGRSLAPATPMPDRPRLVPLSCWEAVYFNHNVDDLLDLARAGAALGCERFVLDDGWFLGRRDDTAGLGDWRVDPTVYPEGLTPLIEGVRALGLDFGLWVEPEMVNPDSELARAHPDWVLQAPGLPQIKGRNQLVLDLARSEVSDHLFCALDALLSHHKIGYLKWDHNRPLTMPGGADGKPSVIAQTEAVYALLDRLRAAHPSVEIESCASGGGRIDLGILTRTHRVWLSDSNDPVERLRMQHVAARFLPPEIVGAHIGPSPAHTSGRETPIAFRAWVAAQRWMGIEMDPRTLSDDEGDLVKRVIGWYRANRAFLHGAECRLLSAPEGGFAELFIAEDRSRFVLFYGVAEAADATGAPPLLLAGLDADAVYDCQWVNAQDCQTASRGADYSAAASLEAGMSIGGALLMQGGLPIPHLFPQSMMVVEGRVL